MRCVVVDTGFDVDAVVTAADELDSISVVLVDSMLNKTLFSIILGLFFSTS